MKFRKKPIVVEAVQYFKGVEIDGLEFNWDNNPMTPDEVTVVTPEGRVGVSEGSWVVIGVNGELYPCKDDIFQKTYEPVEEYP